MAAMKRLRRRLFNRLAALSLVLCVVTTALWARSFFVVEAVFRSRWDTATRRVSSVWVRWSDGKFWPTTNVCPLPHKDSFPHRTSAGSARQRRCRRRILPGGVSNTATAVISKARMAHWAGRKPGSQHFESGRSRYYRRFYPHAGSLRRCDQDSSPEPVSARSAATTSAPRRTAARNAVRSHRKRKSFQAKRIAAIAENRKIVFTMAFQRAGIAFPAVREQHPP